MAERTDKAILNHISELVEEERDLVALQERAQDQQSRLEELNAELDQCWDLLRQRRALREFGEDPNKAQVRSKKTVENYEQ